MDDYRDHATKVVQSARSFWRLANAFSQSYGPSDSGVTHCREEARARIRRLRECKAALTTQHPEGGDGR